jgi:hypothetical protein
MVLQILPPRAAESVKWCQSAVTHAGYRQRCLLLRFSGTAMSAPAATDHAHDNHHEPDAIEAIVPLIPIVLPLCGGVLIFLLAFIAVSMA